MGEKFTEPVVRYKIMELSDSKFLLRKFLSDQTSVDLGFFDNQKEAISRMKGDINPKSWEYDRHGVLIIANAPNEGATKDEV